MPIANVLQPLIDLFEGVLQFFHDTVGLGWGFSIVAMTIVIRAVLLPLALKQVRSMRGMAAIAPQMKVLREKYKDDPQRLNQEMMGLYRENKVNPFASCLPILAQLPVFISLFYLLQDDLRGDICPQSQPATGDSVPCGESPASNFLIIPDITDNATGGVLITLIVLYVASQLGSSLLMMMGNTDRNQRIIFLVLPFVFVPFVLSFPAGLLVYWITTNLWTIVQQLIIKRVVGPAPQPDLSILGAGGGSSSKSSGDRKAGRDGDGGGGRARAGAASGSNGDGNGRARSGEPAGAVPLGGNGAPRGRTEPPPPPPRKKKKQRSGRRR